MVGQHLNHTGYHGNNSTSNDENDIPKVDISISSDQTQCNNKVKGVEELCISNETDSYSNTTRDCTNSSFHTEIVRTNIKKEICKAVIRCKLNERRHIIINEGINPNYLKEIFPYIVSNFNPQTVQYNGGIANIKQWKISCYLEVMDHGVPTTRPNLVLQKHCLPLLNHCNDLFFYWYQQQHPSTSSLCTSDGKLLHCHRLMTFITRYTPAPNEQALLKVNMYAYILLYHWVDKCFIVVLITFFFGF
jgi:hypothetical protein